MTNLLDRTLGQDLPSALFPVMRAPAKMCHGQDKSSGGLDLKNNGKGKLSKKATADILAGAKKFYAWELPRIVFDCIKGVGQGIEEFYAQTLLALFIPECSFLGFFLRLGKETNSQRVCPFKDRRIRFKAFRQSVARNRPSSTAAMRASSSAAQAASLSESKSGGSKLSKSCRARDARSASGNSRTRVTRSLFFFMGLIVN